MIRTMPAVVTILLAVMASNASLGDVEIALVSVADSGSYLLYSYELRNPSSSTWGAASVTMDVSTLSGTPASLPATGPFRDFPASAGGAAPHAKVGPIAPSGWRSTLTTRAELRWTVPTSYSESSDSVAPGDTLAGFGIRSSYFPGLRRVSFAPTMQSCCQASVSTTEEVEYGAPASFAVVGWTVGPRYMPAEIDLDLLQSQLTAVCTAPLWIDDSALCGELADSLDAAEARLAINNVVGGRSAIQSVRDMTVSNHEPSGAVNTNALYLIAGNAYQLLENIAEGLGVGAP